MSEHKRYSKEEEVDDAVFEVCDSKAVPLSRPQLSFSLDLSTAEAKSKRGDDGDDHSFIPVQEREVMVVFDLPDGSQSERAFKLGQTVEVLKSFVESEFGIPMAEQTLFLDEGKKLDNPFSLLDYPQFKGADEVFVRVDGYLPESSKK
jgi:hypothetical protein